MKKIIFGTVCVLVFTGCTGLITGHEYSRDDLKVMYKVTKSGVTTFMSMEQIQALKLDKANIIVTDVYKIVEGNDVDGASTVVPSTK